MSHALAQGFCAHIWASASVASDGTTAVAMPLSAAASQLWSQPTLQVIDVQRRAATRVFYLALSDGNALLWAVVPRDTPVAALVDEGTIDSGTSLTLHAYDTITARNGRPMLVLLDVSADPLRLSLIGAPQYDPRLFVLSPNAQLQQPDTAFRLTQRKRQAEAAPVRWVSVATLFTDADAYSSGDVRWGVQVRVLWKSKLRRVASHRATQGPTQAATTQPQHFVFDCRVVDSDGTGCTVLFWGSRKVFDAITLGSAVRASRGTVRTEDGVPVALQFSDKSPVAVVSLDAMEAATVVACAAAIADGTAPPFVEAPPPESLQAAHATLLQSGVAVADAISARKLPLEAAREVGGAPFTSVAAVREVSSIGDTVNFQGVVVHATPVTQCDTKRGRVERCTLTVADPPTESTRRQTVQVTLWGALCHAPAVSLAVANADGGGSEDAWWCFRDFSVRMFGNDKVVSSKSASEILRPIALLGRVLAEKVKATQQRARSGSRPPAEGDPRPAPEPPLFSTRLDTTAATPTPTVVRIEEVRQPLFFTACKGCGRKARHGTPCTHCHATAAEERFLLQCVISDGAVRMAVTGFTHVAEQLFGESTASFLQQAAVDPAFVPDAIARITGLPLLAKVQPPRPPSVTPLLVSLEHLHLGVAARFLADLLEAA